MKKLLVKRAGAVEQQVEIGASALAIGRAADNDVVLLDPSISRHHARVEAQGSGFRIVDLDSGNGVVHEGERVRELALYPGCEVALGDYTLELEGEAPAAKLVLIAGGERRSYPLRAGETVVGRSSEAGITLPDPLVSGKHFKISTKGDVHALVDLGSENGTYVNGVRVRERELAQGDQIRVAGITFYFAADGVEPEPGSVELLQPTLSAAPPAARKSSPPRADAPAARPAAPSPAAKATPARPPLRLLLVGGGLAVVVLLLVAVILLRSPEDAAEKEFQNVFQSDLTAEAQQRIEEYQARAEEYEERGNLELALEQHRKILVLDPTHQSSLAETARLEEELQARQAQEEEQARETRERLAKMAELTEQADRALAGNDFAEARKLLDSARELSPESEVVSSRIASAWAAEGDYYRARDVGRARTAYQRALELDPDLAEARRGLARIQQSQQASRRRREEIDELTETGLGQLRREEFREAYATFTRVLQLDPENDRAKDFQAQASDLLEQQVRPIYEEAVRLYNAGEIEAAMREFQRALELHPDHADTRAFLNREMDRVRAEAVDRYKRAYIYEGLGRLREALDLYRQTLALLPDPKEEYHQKASERIAELTRKLQ